MRRIIGAGWKRITAAALLIALLGGCATAPEPVTTPPAEAVAQPAQADVTDETAAPGGAEPAGGPATAAVGDAADAATPTTLSAADSAEAGSAPAAEQASTAAPAALALAAPSELLDSYRVAGSLVVTSYLPGGGVHVASTEVEGDWLRSDGPFAFDAAFTLTNSSGDQRQELSVVAIDDDAALRSEGAWATIRRDAAVPYGAPDGLLLLPFVARINRGETLGSENLGGIPVTHYRLTDPAIFSAAMQDIMPDSAGSVQSVLLEGWVADAGFVVKHLLQVTLADAEFIDDAGNRLAVQQQIDASYQLSDVDAVRVIEWPADAPAPETITVPGFVPNTFPLPAEATATPHLGKVEIRTPLPEIEVADFYRTRLGELGWDFDGEPGFYTASKDGQVLNLTILFDEVSGETQITVFAASEP